MLKFDHKKFFDGVKDRIDSTLEQDQVDGLEFLLTSFENDARWTDLRHIAYALATTFHETAHTFQPIDEIGSTAYFNRRYGPQSKVGRNLGNTKEGDGARYHGRGYVQLTGRDNYRKYGYEDNPGKVKEPEVAFEILTEGMFKGGFTGHKFKEYINAHECDYVEARRIINRLDKAGLIEGYAKSFEKILKSSLISAPTASTDQDGNKPEPEGSNSITVPAGSPSDPTEQPAPTVEVPPTLEGQPKLTIWERLTGAQEKVDKVTSFGNSLSPISNSSRVAVLTTKAGGWLMLALGFLGDHWLWVIGVILILAGIWYLREAKKNAAARLVAEKK